MADEHEIFDDPDAVDKEQYQWEEDFQRMILALLLNDNVFLTQSFGLIKPDYFTNEIHQDVCRWLFKHFDEYQVLPRRQFIQQFVEDKIKEKPADVKMHWRGEINVVYEHYVPGVEDRDFLRDKILDFAKEQAVKIAFFKCLDEFKTNKSQSKWSKINTTLSDALAVDRDFDIGEEYFQTYEERYICMVKAKEDGEVFTSGFKSIDSSLQGGGLLRGEIGSWTGLCFGKDTPILMFDGTIKKVQDVGVGDLVMGDDSNPRKVLELSHGHGPLYIVRPVKGDSYVINENHILSLKNSHKTPQRKCESKTGYIRPNVSFVNHPSKAGNVFNISIKDYFKQSAHFRKYMKGYRTGVEYCHKDVKIDPYILGVWLGDGDRQSSNITNIDKEIIRAFYKEAKSRKLSIRKYKERYSMFSKKNAKKSPGKGFSYNNLLEDLKYYNLIQSYCKGSKIKGHKHIPYDYKVNDKNTRLNILAGILDTDGSKSGPCGYDFINKSKDLAEDVVYICRSLGLAAYIHPCKKSCQNGFVGNYWRVSISGDCAQIPVKVERKKCENRKQIKDHLVTGIKVSPIGSGEYYGFTVDGNHLFLLGDFTVVHNSGSGKSLSLVKASVANLHRRKKVLYISTELDQYRVAERFDAQLADPGNKFGVGIKNLIPNKQIVFDALGEFTKDYEDPRRLIIKHFPSGEMDVDTMRAYYKQLQMRGFHPDLVIVDYIGEMKDFDGMKTYESRYRIIRSLKGFASREKVCLLTAMQADRSARGKVNLGEVIDDDNLADSFGQTRPLDALWTLSQRKAEYEAKVARVFVSKHRFGESRFEFHIEMDRDRTLEMREISKAEWERRLTEVSAHKEVTSRDDQNLQQLAEEQKKKWLAKKKLKNDPAKIMDE